MSINDSLMHIIKQTIREAGATTLPRGSYNAKDLLLPASIVTLSGLLIVLMGVFMLQYWYGVLLVLIGRSFDLLDGPIARATHHVTPTSIIVDPVADKIALAAMLISASYHDLAPTSVVLYILIVNVIVALLSVVSERKGVARGALLPGKLGLFFQSISLITFTLIPHVSNHAVLHSIAVGSIVLSLPCAAIAIWQYSRQLRHS
jgi:phosphatidylglycerophosphate synthase